ncbi:hypothetical protein M2146_002775, partial [Lachnospiraceae bacterium PF1-22]
MNGAKKQGQSYPVANAPGSLTPQLHFTITKALQGFIFLSNSIFPLPRC